jgi:hypothetical protein
MLRTIDGDASSVREEGGTSLGTGLRSVGVVSEAPHRSRQLEQFLEEVEFGILAILKRGNEDYAPSPRSKAVNGLLANLQGQDQVVVPTDKTNSFRLVDLKELCQKERVALLRHSWTDGANMLNDRSEMHGSCRHTARFHRLCKRSSTDDPL